MEEILNSDLIGTTVEWNAARSKIVKAVNQALGKHASQNFKTYVKLITSVGQSGTMGSILETVVRLKKFIPGMGDAKRVGVGVQGIKGKHLLRN